MRINVEEGGSIARGNVQTVLSLKHVEFVKSHVNTELGCVIDSFFPFSSRGD